MKDRRWNIVDMAAPIGVCFMLLAAVLLMFFFLRGQTTSSGGYPAPDVTVSVSCSGKNIEYSYFSYDISTSNDVEVNAIVTNDNISSISLKYKFYYDDEKALQAAYSILHGDMNKSFGVMGADALGANYAMMGGYLKFSLTASGGEITVGALKYFLLDDGTTSYDTSELSDAYEKVGMSCIEKNR